MVRTAGGLITGQELKTHKSCGKTKKKKKSLLLFFHPSPNKATYSQASAIRVWLSLGRGDCYSAYHSGIGNLGHSQLRNETSYLQDFLYTHLEAPLLQSMLPLCCPVPLSLRIQRRGHTGGRTVVSRSPGSHCVWKRNSPFLTLDYLIPHNLRSLDNSLVPRSRQPVKNMNFKFPRFQWMLFYSIQIPTMGPPISDLHCIYLNCFEMLITEC